MQRNEDIDRLNELLKYDPLTGNIFVRKSERILVADENGQVSVYDSKNKPALRRFLLDKLAFALALNKWPRKDQRILHKNLNKNDNRLCNIVPVSRAIFNKINEANKNLETGIRMQTHPVDQYKYMVYWYENSGEKVKVVNDVVNAKTLVLQLKLKYSKILTKYCCFE